MRLFYLTILSLFIGISVANAQSENITPIAQKINTLLQLNETPTYFAPFEEPDFEVPKHEDIVKNATYFEVNESVLNSILTNHFGFIEIAIPFKGELLQLQLIPSQIFAPDFKIKNSKNEFIHYEGGAYYKGIVKGDNASFVAMSFYNNRIKGIISTKQHGNIVVANLRSSPIHTIYQDRDLLITNPFICTSNDEDILIDLNDAIEGVEAIDPCLRVYIETDYQLYQEEGGIIQAADQIVDLFNVVSTLYYNEEITIIISEIYVWVTEDPYPHGSSDEALEYFRDYRPTFDGNLAHLVTYDVENLGGIAYLPGVCTSYKYAYSNIDNYFADFPTFSWTPYVFTHESGHNLGSPHTQNCGWPGGAIDNCYETEGACSPGPAPVDGGTIMSYCHLSPTGINFANGFGPLPGDLIRDTYSDVGCLDACDLPPANDWPCDATILPVNGECIFIDGSNIGAINSVVATVACDGISEGDVWFKVTMPPVGYVIIDTDNGAIVHNMGMKVYSGSCTSLTSYPDGCVSNGSTYSPLMPGITLTGTPGVNYYLRLWEVGNDAFGSFSICAYTDCASSYPADEINTTDPLICIGESTTLTVEGGALGDGGTWNWYSGSCTGTPVGTGETITVSPTTPTTYYVKVIGECNTTTCVSKTININPQPAVPVIVNTDCILSVELVDGLNYQWYLDGTLIAGENENTTTVLANGTYTVTATNATGCIATSEALDVTCQGLNLQSINAATIHIFPNPGNGIFTLSINGINGDIAVTITDITGQIIASQSHHLTTINNNLPIELNVAAGMYFVKVGKPDAYASTLLVIE